MGIKPSGATMGMKYVFEQVHPYLLERGNTLEISEYVCSQLNEFSGQRHVGTPWLINISRTVTDDYRWSIQLVLRTFHRYEIYSSSH